MSGWRDDPLARLAARLNAPPQLEEVLRAVCEEAARALGAPAATLDLYDERRALFYPAAALGLPPAGTPPAPFGVAEGGLSPQGPKGTAVPAVVPNTEGNMPAGTRPQAVPAAVHNTEGIVPGKGGAHVMNASGVEPARSSGRSADVRPPLAAARHELYAEWGARLLAQAQIGSAEPSLGTLNVFTFDAEQRCGSDEQALLQAIADQAAQAIDHLRLAALAARRLEFAQAVQTMDLAVMTNQDVRVMLRVCLQQITSFLPVDAADVRLLHSNTLKFLVGRGLRADAWQRATPRLGEGPAGRAALEGSMHPALDLGREDYMQPLVSEEGFASAVAVPLIVRGQTLGVLEVFNRVRLDPDAEWLECLQAMARKVAIGVDQANLHEGLERARVELTLSHDEAIECWLRALELRDGAHTARAKHLADLSVLLAEAAGIPAGDLLHVRRGALLHDVGVLCLPEGLLRKPGPYNAAELVSMRRHPELARELLSSNAYLRRALDIPEYHHERWDGSGYPHGLRGERIPLAARVFAVVDVWEALRTHRPHRAAWSDKQALAHIISESGLHFDPRIVDLFRDLLADGRLPSA